MNEEDVNRLCSIIKNNQNVTILSLLGCNLSQSQTELIVDSVIKNETLLLVSIEKFDDFSQALKDKIHS